MTSRTHSLLSTCGIAALLLIPSFAQPAPQTSPSPKSTKQPPSSLMSDARTVLGKVNYDRARELTQKLQATLRTIKSRQRHIVSARTDPNKQRKLEVQLDEDLGEAMEETIAILDFLHEYGFEDVIYKHKEELSKGFTERSLPPYEKEIFLNAGFSEQDFDEFVSLFELHGHEILVALEKSGGVSGLKDRLRIRVVRDKGARYRNVKAYLKISAGGLAVVGDGTIAIFVEIVPPVALGILSSVSSGLSAIGDGVKELGDEPK